MSLAGSETSNEDVLIHSMCKRFHCLPSQLEKEDAKTMQKMMVIENELERQNINEQRRLETQSLMKSGG